MPANFETVLRRSPQRQGIGNILLLNLNTKNESAYYRGTVLKNCTIGGVIGLHTTYITLPK